MKNEVKWGNVNCIILYDEDFYHYFQINNPAVIFQETTHYLKYYIVLPLANTVAYLACRNRDETVDKSFCKNVHSSIIVRLLLCLFIIYCTS